MSYLEVLLCLLLVLERLVEASLQVPDLHVLHGDLLLGIFQLPLATDQPGEAQTGSAVSHRCLVFSVR